MAGPHTTTGYHGLRVVDSRKNAGLPRILIPREYAVNEGHLQFNISTEFGCIEVESRGENFLCWGSGAALQAAGVLRVDWLPGAPGNAKTRQMVVFDGNAPYLPPRVTSSLEKRPHITIFHHRKGLFLVHVPADEGQRAILKQELARHVEEKRARVISDAVAAADASAHRRSLQLTQADFHSQCLGFINAADQLLSGLCDDSRYAYDATSLEKIRHLTRELRGAVDQGRIVAKPSRRSEGNVVHLTF